MLKIQTFIVGPIETNCYLAYDGETYDAILIDPGAYDKRIVDFIRGKKLKVQYTVNTHGHYDHIGGDKAFGYRLLIHEKDAGCLSDPVRSLSIIAGQFINGINAYRLLKDQSMIHVKGLSFKVIHTPGHSPGGITLECEDVLFTGDTLFCEGVGRTDLPFGSEKELGKSIAKLLAYDDNTRIYPGHGPSSTIGHEKNNNPFLEFSP